MIVSNSSPLISLGKQGILYLLRKCFDKVAIPHAVYEEISRKKDSPECARLQQAIREKWIVVRKVSINPLLVTEKLGNGEKEAISLASKMKYLLLIDDDYAKTYASLLNVEAHGLIYVIYRSYSKRFIDKKKAVSLVDQMVAAGFYLSTETYAKFLDLLNGSK
ncbi:DUF3368 domain-containing protein [Candidatus Woesearchaeota archaeon]|nr:DUF3368 domain-containing protein [Candidatus Woesearchaeota archaeon]